MMDQLSRVLARGSCLAQVEVVVQYQRLAVLGRNRTAQQILTWLSLVGMLIIYSLFSTSPLLLRR